MNQTSSCGCHLYIDHAILHTGWVRPQMLATGQPDCLAAAYVEPAFMQRAFDLAILYQPVRQIGITLSALTVSGIYFASQLVQANRQANHPPPHRDRKRVV